MVYSVRMKYQIMENYFARASDTETNKIFIYRVQRYNSEFHSVGIFLKRSACEYRRSQEVNDRNRPEVASRREESGEFHEDPVQ